jgi:predicted transglutaminase-like cysteine proteinase
MPLAGPAMPPAGFVAYCTREPAYCPGATEPVAQQDVAAVQPASASPPSATAAVTAGRLYWAAVFARQAAPEQSQAMLEQRSPGPPLHRTGRYDWSAVLPNATNSYVHKIVFASAPVPSQATPALSTSEPDLSAAAKAGALPAKTFAPAIQAAAFGLPVGQPAVKDASPVAQTVDWTPQNQRLIEGVNRDINGRIIGRSDEMTYGLADYWNTPLSTPHEGPTYGDCKDYVIEKRRALMDAGLPASALSIAIVKTHWNATHAVLLVATDKGEMVLDNLSPWVTAWNRLDYRWIERQAPGSTLTWVGVGNLELASR